MKGKGPKVSVLVLNYNGKVHLKECFNSLEVQTYSNYEVILVDNGSKDDSIKFVKKNFQWDIIDQLYGGL